MIKKSKQTVALGMIGTIALILTTSVLVAPLTSWLISINRSVGESNSKLEAVTVSQSEWERLQHMSLNELRSNKTALATPYNVGDGFQVKVNLGAEGYFSGGKCGNIPSGKTANCFKDTTITVFNSDGDRLFSSRQLPLQTGIYTAEEIDAKLTAMNNALKNDYTTKINNEATARANADNSLTARLNSNYYTKAEIDKLFEEKGTGLTYKDYLYLNNSGQGSNGLVTGSVQRETYIGNYLLSTQTVKSFGGYNFTETYNGHTIQKVIDWAGSVYVDGNFVGGIYDVHNIKYLLDSKKI